MRDNARRCGHGARKGGAARTEGPDQLDVLDLVGHRERGGGREAKIGEQRRHVRRVAAVVVRLRRVLRPSTSIRRGSAGSAAGKPGGATQRRLGERRWRTGESRRRSGEIGRDRARSGERPRACVGAKRVFVASASRAQTVRPAATICSMDICTEPNCCGCSSRRPMAAVRSYLGETGGDQARSGGGRAEAGGRSHMYEKP